VRSADDRREPQRTFLVVGHFGGPNVGDEAMLLGLVEGLRVSSAARLVISTKTGEIPPAVVAFDGVEACKRGIVSDVARAIRLRNVIFCGGTHFHDAFTGLRLWYQYLSLARYVAISAAAKLRGGQALWLGMGFGPLHTRPGRLLCRYATLLPDEIVVRDSASLVWLREIQPEARATLGFDLAALMSDDYRRVSSVTPSSDRLVVGVAPAGVVHFPTELTAIELYKPLGRTLAELVGRSGGIVRIFVFSGGGIDSDRALVTALERTWREDYSLDCEILDRPDDPVWVMKEISLCDVMIAARYHSVMLSYLTGRPTVALAYHTKVDQLADEIGLPDQARLSLANLRDGADADTIRTIASCGRRPSLSLSDARARAAANIRAITGAWVTAGDVAA